MPLDNNPAVMPFELKALEVCLESVSQNRCIDCLLSVRVDLYCHGFHNHSTRRHCIPSNRRLDAPCMVLSVKRDVTVGVWQVNTKNLQRVRAVKSKIAHLKTRVETVKEILEKFLDDDDDMRDMNLTAKQQTHRTPSLTFDHISVRFDRSNSQINISKLET